MTSVIVRGIGALCTCDPERGDAPGVVQDAALMARDGIITYAGPERELDRSDIREGTIEVHARGAAVVPGFVDAHTHIVWLGDRGDEYARRASGTSYEEIASAGGGIRATVRTTAAGSVEELTTTARRRALEMLAHGTTTIEVKSGYGLEHEAEMRQLDAALHLRAYPDLPDVVPTYLPLQALPDGSREAYIDDVCNRGVVDAAKRAGFIDAFCETGAFTVDECERVFSAGRPHHLRPKIHAEQRSHSGGAMLAARVRSGERRSPRARNGRGLRRARERRGGRGHAARAHRSCSAGRHHQDAGCIDAGCTVAVATDCNPGTSYTESMPLMISLAVAQGGLTPAEALAAATTGGAAALGLKDRGMLRQGMRCDAVILNSQHWIDIAYHLGGDVVGSVLLQGRLAVPSKT